MKRVEIKVTDKDGSPFYFAGVTHSAAQAFRERHEGLAKAHNCFLREIPRVGAISGQKWHRDFDVMERDGHVVGVTEKAPTS